MCLSESVFLGWEKGNVRYRKSMLHHTGNYELLLICMQNSVLQQRSHSGQHCLLRQSSHNLLNLWIKGKKKKDGMFLIATLQHFIQLSDCIATDKN